MEKEYRKACKICGKEFLGKTHNATYCLACKNSEIDCPICGKLMSIFRKTCSKRCSAILRNRNDNYINPFSKKEVQEKIKNTNLIKYGVENPALNKECIEKMKQTNIERYGVPISSQNANVKEKMIQTNLSKYGVKSTLQLPEIKEKAKLANLQKFGTENPFFSKEFQAQIHVQNIKKFGGASPQCSKIIRNKTVNNCIEKYGVSNPKQKHYPDWLKPATYNNEYLLKLVEDVKTGEELIWKYPDHYKIINGLLSKIDSEFDFNRVFSKGEQRISKYLLDKQIKSKTQYVFKNCKNKSYLKFDFAIFDEFDNITLLIEYQGIQHYEPVDIFGGEEYFKIFKKRDNIKRQYCKEHNIRLLEIPYWEYDNIENILNNIFEELKNKT